MSSLTTSRATSSRTSLSPISRGFSSSTRLIPRRARHTAQATTSRILPNTSGWRRCKATCCSSRRGGCSRKRSQESRPCIRTVRVSPSIFRCYQYNALICSGQRAWNRGSRHCTSRLAPLISLVPSLIYSHVCSLTVRISKTSSGPPEPGTSRTTSSVSLRRSTPMATERSNGRNTLTRPRTC